MSPNSNAAQLTETGALIDAGKAKMVIDTVLPPAEARQVYEASEGGHTRGKIILQIAD